MDRAELIAHAKQLAGRAEREDNITGVFTEASEFLRTYAGPKSSFTENMREYNPLKWSENFAAKHIAVVLYAFATYLEAGLHQQVTPERRAQLDIVSDFLSMAQSLLENRQFHPAAAAVLIGATLEEFLRNWVEAENLSLGNRKPAMEAYSQVLRDAELLSKQDAKDITSWAGVRNHAAHGEWQEVQDRERVQLMLEGVNLFMRKYTPA
jgi:hypothetical protein